MDNQAIVEQNLILMPLLIDAHASLSAKASIGQFLLFDAKTATIAEQLSTAIRKRRVSHMLVKILAPLSEASSMVVAYDLQTTIDSIREAVSNPAWKDEAAFNGHAMGQAIRLADSLERTRLCVKTLIDFCEAVGVAPNGALLPKERT